MQKKLMIVFTALVVGGVSDCQAAREERAQGIRMQVKRAAQCGTPKVEFRNGVRVKAPAVKLRRTAREQGTKAERREGVLVREQNVRTKHKQIDAIRKEIKRRALPKN